MEEYKKVTVSFTNDQLEKLDEIMSREQSRCTPFFIYVGVL